jgi:outer membrane protein insertion porin family
LQLTQDLSVGGSASFSRTQLISQAHVGLGSGLSFTLDAEGGYIAPMNGDKIPLFERFYIGDSSMRGFDFRGIGPKIRPTAAKAGQNVAIGGQAYYVARSELSANLDGTFGRLGFQPGLFVDVGSVFAAGKERLLPGETLIGNSPKPRASVGVGLALGLPAGKLRLNFVKPLFKQQATGQSILLFRSANQSEVCCCFEPDEVAKYVDGI